MSTLHRPPLDTGARRRHPGATKTDRSARPVTDYLERSGGIALVVGAGTLAAGFATIMRVVLPS